nr:hypothetical protein [uncultured Sellimonas sp.]
MKKAKKMFAVVAATIMVLSMGMVSVNAAEVQPRLPLCPCGGTMVPSKSYTAWTTYDSKKCTHGYAYGTDQYKRRMVTTTMKCNRCENGYISSKEHEYKVECTGHN